MLDDAKKGVNPIAYNPLDAKSMASPTAAASGDKPAPTPTAAAADTQNAAAAGEVYGLLPAGSMGDAGAAAGAGGGAAPSTATGTGVAAVAGGDALDIDIENKMYWWGAAGRDVCATNLKQNAEYLFRVCGDPGERIDGKPNPNLFVLSYAESGEIKNMKVWRFPGEGLGQDRTKNCKIHKTVDALTRAIMGEKARGIANPAYKSSA